MSRTTRTYPYGDEAFHKGQRESTCKPGCGICAKGPDFRRSRSKIRRREAWKELKDAGYH